MPGAVTSYLVPPESPLTVGSIAPMHNANATRAPDTGMGACRAR
jgi:hypothetical protein